MTSKKDNFNYAYQLVTNKLKEIRKNVKNRKFDCNKVAEIEINKSFFKGKVVDRIMVVLRATGCQHYKMNGGCSMCGHFDGTPMRPVTTKEYIQQWKNVVNGEAIEDDKKRKSFNINNFPILCLYNLGSLLNANEVPARAVREIFKSINALHGIKKTIIESRAEYVSESTLKTISEVHDGLVEVGIGLESSNYEIRELCHHKNMPNIDVFINANKILKNNGFKALAYVNLKPIFLTEKEAVEDAIETTVFAFKHGSDAVSLEPTSLQADSLTDHLYKLGLYRVPWLGSVREVIRGVYNRLKPHSSLDLRIGGYFNEEVLSGSQGVAPGVIRNEIFPYMTSGNCNVCTPGFINAIRRYNKHNDVKILDRIKKCKYCYSSWQDAMKVKDSRTIAQRVIDTLG